MGRGASLVDDGVGGMKTKDQTATTAKKSIAVGPVAGERLPTPPRERKPALAALAALLVLVGALGTTVLVMRAGDRIEVVKITERVPAGQPIPQSAIESVLVADDPSIHYVPWNQRGALEEELRPNTDLVAGTILVGEMLSGEETLPEDQVMIGLSLQPGQFPTGLEPGDTVRAYWVGEDDVASAGGAAGEAAPGTDAILADEAKVAAIHGEEDPADNSALPVTLRVAAADAPDLTRYASAGEVSLVIVAPRE
jgi:hypothetical protein